MLNMILGPIIDILGKLVPDVNKRAELQAEITKALIDNQQAMLNAAKEVMVADSQSESWLARSARPIVVMWSVGLISYLAVIAPMLGIQKEAIAAIQAVPDSLWNLTAVGIGGYMLARTVDKAVEAYKSK